MSELKNDSELELAVTCASEGAADASSANAAPADTTVDDESALVDSVTCASELNAHPQNEATPSEDGAANAEGDAKPAPRRVGLRRQAREAALQALFMCDFIAQWDTAVVNFCFDHFLIPKPVRPFALQLCEGTLLNLSKIDSKLTCASEHWSLSRMARVDRTILRVATFEIVHLDEVPINVAINEAIEIAKRYGSDESPQFINGVLDRVASMVRPKGSATRAPAASRTEALAPRIEGSVFTQSTEFSPSPAGSEIETTEFRTKTFARAVK